MPKILIIAIILGMLTAGGIFVLVKRQTPSLPANNLNNLDSDQVQNSLPAEEIYNDEAGFSFKYFSEAKVADVTPNDDSYYSLLNVSKGTSSLTVKVQDGTYKPPAGAKLIGARTLGGMKASQYSYEKTGDTYLVTFANIEGIIYLIESKSDNGYLDSLHTEIADSFMIGAQTKTSSGSSNIIDEGEEIVE